MSMSQYGDYIKERLGDEIIESELGFITYVVNKDNVYVKEVYIVPEFRGRHAASELCNQVVDKAAGLGLTKIYGSVVPSANGSNTSLKVLLAYGFVLDSAADNFIILRKDI